MFNEIEHKWQQYWEDNRTFEAMNGGSKIKRAIGCKRG